MTIKTKKLISAVSLALLLNVAVFSEKAEKPLSFMQFLAPAGVVIGATSLYGGLLLGLTHGLSAGTTKALIRGASNGAIFGGTLATVLTVPPLAAYICGRNTINHLRKIEVNSHQANNLENQIYINNNLFE